MSESRGKEAAGLVINNLKNITYGKTPFPAQELVHSRSFKQHLLELTTGQYNGLAAIGHSRLGGPI